MTWAHLTEWWLSEIEHDPAYAEVVEPLLLDLLRPEQGHLYLDLGCGEGRVMRAVVESGAIAHGVDLNADLAARTERSIVADLLHLPVAHGRYDGVYSAVTLEHVADHGAFFHEAARVTRPGGVLAIVVNHPAWTAPGSTPITDTDGEVLWRPGDYFSHDTTEIPAGDSSVTFHHRSMADLLNAASAAGWSLERMVEQPHHEYEDQAGILRLLACRWRLG